MGAQQANFNCPDCGFLVHNRGYPKCERCQKGLPARLLLTKEERDAAWNSMIAERAKERASKDDDRWWSRKISPD